MPRIYKQRRSIHFRFFRLLAAFALLFTALNSANQNTTKLTATSCSDLKVWEQRLQHTSSGPLVFLAWTTRRQDWRKRNWLALESLFVHHPDARVTVVSSTLNTNFFHRFTRQGYDILTVELTPDIALHCGFYAGSTSEKWLKHVSRARGKYLYTHWTDYLRFILLNRFGGIYLDTDALLLQPLPMNGTYVGRDHVMDEHCSWCPRDPLTSERYYFAPGVIVSDKSRFTELIETTFDTQTYDAACFNCVGPLAFTNFILDSTTDFQSLPVHSLYPFDQDEIHRVFLESEQFAITARALQYCSVSMHMYGHTTRKLHIHRRSVLQNFFELYSFAYQVPSSFFFHIQLPRVRIRSLGPVVYMGDSSKCTAIFTGPSGLLLTSDFKLFETVNVTLSLMDECGLLFMCEREEETHEISVSLQDVTVATVNTMLTKVCYRHLTSKTECKQNYRTEIHVSLSISGFVDVVSKSVDIVVFPNAVTVLITAECVDKLSCDELASYKRSLTSRFPDIEVVFQLPAKTEVGPGVDQNHYTQQASSLEASVREQTRRPYLLVMEKLASSSCIERIEAEIKLLVEIIIGGKADVVGTMAHGLPRNIINQRRSPCIAASQAPDVFIVEATKYYQKRVDIAKILECAFIC